MSEGNINVRPNKLIAALLRELSVEVGRGSVEHRRMNRALLRGFRAGLMASQPQVDAVAMDEALRHELGLQPSFQRRQPVPAGTAEVVTK